MREMLARLEILRLLLDGGTKSLPWCGRLAIQKLVYLLQAVFGVELGYNYGLHQLGPYSFELASALSLGEQMGLWRSWEETYTSANGSGRGTRFQVNDSDALPPEERAQAACEWTSIEPAVQAALTRLAGTSGRKLELIATIHYLRHVQQVDEDQLAGVLRFLKPKFSAEEIEAGREQLASLESTAGELVAA
jgi:uncharacterized protein YwgA